MLVLALVTLGMLWRHGAAPAAAWFAIGALGASALGLGAYQAGRYAGQQQSRAEIHGLRQQAAALAQLQPGWQWRTDSQHRIVHWQAPADSLDGAANHLPQPTNTGAAPLAWEFLFAADAQAAATLARHMQARANVAAVVGLLDSAGPHWQCMAVPCLDSQGLFMGYVGSAVPNAAAPPKPEARPLPPPPEQIDQEEQAAFNYTVSHDLRAPIRVVEGFTRILKEDYGRVLDRIGNDHLERVLAAAARMNNMIDAMLALARLSTQPLQRQPVNLSQMAEYILDDLRRGQPERLVQHQVTPNLATQGDPTLLRQVLENLLNNAWKYSARREVAHITVGGELREGRWVYWVQDDGAGFDMRYADRLFGAFQRLHGGNEFAGTGIGLVSVRRILRRHGGDIWAQAEPEKGARFEFTFGAD
jgi:signal transduction histidine kinase